MQKDNSSSSLGSNRVDYAVSALKGLLGIAPVAGPILAEVIGTIIPNQRIDRLAAFVEKLAAEFVAEGRVLAVEHFSRQEQIDLFEEGALQSSRALSTERLEYIAKIVTFGLSGELKAQIEAKRLLNAIRTLDDDQLVILSSYLRRNVVDDEFNERHVNILYPPRYHGEDDFDGDTTFEFARSGLHALGLIAHHFVRPRKGEPPEFDERTGMLKSSSTMLTPLGRLLLRRIGLAGQDDY